jgi:hypothetical protein
MIWLRNELSPPSQFQQRHALLDRAASDAKEDSAFGLRESAVSLSDVCGDRQRCAAEMVDEKGVASGESLSESPNAVGEIDRFLIHDVTARHDDRRGPMRYPCLRDEVESSERIVLQSARVSFNLVRAISSFDSQEEHPMNHRVQIGLLGLLAIGTMMVSLLLAQEPKATSGPLTQAFAPPYLVIETKDGRLLALEKPEVRTLGNRTYVVGRSMFPKGGRGGSLHNFAGSRQWICLEDIRDMDEVATENEVPVAFEMYRVQEHEKKETWTTNR